MCGIVGIVGSDRRSTLDALRRMAAAVAHRGPDDSGEEIVSIPGAVVGLGHRRLAILDLSPLGHQPMGDAATGNWLSYNGEIYNLGELREELKGRGHQFRSRTDTEVLLAAYGEWGLEAFPRLRGMFALGLWDGSLQRLVLARDPFGIKPLYYCRLGNLFLFASEVRALLASGLVPRRLSLEGLVSYLQSGSVQGPWTIVRELRSLPPGHYMVIEPRQKGPLVEERNYAGQLPSSTTLSDEALSYEEAITSIRESLKESVRLHLASDVPLGVFLSGGIDSSAIVALMSQVAKERPRTFSVVFAEKKFSEASHARLVAERFGTDHREIHLTEKALVEMLPAACLSMDQPTMDGINTYVISKAVRETGITVALSGLGGDELFAGYPSFRRVRGAGILGRVPSWVRRASAAAGARILNHTTRQRKAWDFLAADGSPGSVYALSRELFSAGEIAALMNGASPPGTLRASIDRFPDDPVNAMSLFELKGYMANTLLRDTDFMSMAHALEVRVPFIDSTIVPQVLKVPGEWKLDSRRPKPLLLDAVGALLPEEVWRRPKMGFTLPFERWMLGALAEEIDDVLSNNRVSLSMIGLDSSEVQRVWRKFQVDPAAVGWSRPWALYILARWCELNQVTT